MCTETRQVLVSLVIMSPRKNNRKSRILRTNFNRRDSIDY